MASGIGVTARRNGRWLVVTMFVGLLAAVLGWAVMPGASATTYTPIPPDVADSGITPAQVNVGGTTFNCGTVGSAGTYFLINNPRDGNFPISGTPYSVTLSSTTKTSTIWRIDGGAKVVDLGVNGGTTTAWYDYTSAGLFYYTGSSGPHQGIEAAGVNGVATDGTTSKPVHATVKSDGTPYNLSVMSFCYVAGASLSGTVYRDADLSGSLTGNPLEVAPSAGWSVRVYSGATLVGTALANATSGQYSLQVPSGTNLKVCVVKPSTETWTLTEPSGTTPTCTGTNELPVGRAVTAIALNGTASDQNFGVRPPDAPVSGTVFQDNNGNGSFDAGDATLSGWTVRIYNGATGLAGESVVTGKAPFVTLANGAYSFSVMSGNAYHVCVTPPANRWRQTAPTGSTNCFGTNELPAAVSVSALAVSGVSNQNFGNVQIANITGTVFNDVDISRASSTGDTPYSGATVRLYKPDGTPIASTTSAAAPVNAGDPAAGSYAFNDIDAGSYVVCLGSITGYGETFPNNGNPPATAPTAGSTACTSTWTGAPFYRGHSVTLAGDVSGKDFGIVPAVSFCNPPDPLPGQYEIKLAHCKPDQSFITRYTDGATVPEKTAELIPVREDLPPTPMVEKITWSLVNGGQLEIRYDDSYVPTVPHYTPVLMKTCKLDPRDSAALTWPGFTLKTAYDDFAEVGDVLPAGETSCLIISTIASPSPGFPNGSYVAYVYSSIDGLRVGDG